MNSNIAKERLAHGWTQLQLAEKVDVSPQTVSEWECNQRLPKKETLLKLKHLFDKPIDYLLEQEEEPQRPTSSAASAHPSAPPGSLARR